MAKIHKEILIGAEVERIYDFMTRPENLPEIWPSLVQVKNVKRKADGSHSFDWVYKMAGIRFKGRAHTESVEQNRSVAVRNEKGLASSFLWRYEPRDGQTLLKLDIEYLLPSKALERLAAPLLTKLNESEAETLMRNLKLRMEMTGEQAA